MLMAEWRHKTTWKHSHSAKLSAGWPSRLMAEVILAFPVVAYILQCMTLLVVFPLVV